VLHSGKPPFFKKRKKSSPSALEAALGEAPFLKKKNASSPSATAQTLGEATSNFFLKKLLLCLSNKDVYMYLHHKPQINNNISQIAFINHKVLVKKISGSDNIQYNTIQSH
jgi:hypothetical protein